MSDRIDDRIRELYVELTEAAPEVPPLRAPASRRLVVGRPVAMFAGAAAVLALVVAVGAVVLTQLDLGADDDAAAVAPPSTAAPAATFAPGAGEGADLPGRPRPTERILLLADLNRACAVADESFDAGLPAELTSEDDYRTAFTLILHGLESLRALVEDADPDLEDPELLVVRDRIMAAEGLAVVGQDGPVRSRYDDAVGAVESLSEFLVAFGAADCGDFGVGLP